MLSTAWPKISIRDVVSTLFCECTKKRRNEGTSIRAESPFAIKALASATVLMHIIYVLLHFCEVELYFILLAVSFLEKAPFSCSSTCSRCKKCNTDFFSVDPALLLCVLTSQVLDKVFVYSHPSSSMVSDESPGGALGTHG